MEIKELQIGDKIEIQVKKSSGILAFQSEIIAILDDERVIVSEIMFEEQSVGFTAQDRTSFIHIGTKLHRWPQPNISLVRYKKLLCHCVQLKGSGSPYNRRDSYRLYIGCEYPICYPTAQGIVNRTVLVKDISAGGIAFIIPDKEEPIPMNKQVRIHIVDGHYDMNLHAEVIRTAPLKEQHAILYGCRFLTPQAVVNQYIMHKQGIKNKNDGRGRRMRPIRGRVARK